MWTTPMTLTANRSRDAAAVAEHGARDAGIGDDEVERVGVVDQRDRGRHRLGIGDVDEDRSDQGARGAAGLGHLADPALVAAEQRQTHAGAGIRDAPGPRRCRCWRR